MRDVEPSFLQGFFWCLWDSETVLLQTSQWKRKLLAFMSGVCLEISSLPYLAGWMESQSTALAWFITLVFLLLGLVGLYAGKFGDDRFVELLLVMPKLKRKT